MQAVLSNGFIEVNRKEIKEEYLLLKDRLYNSPL